MQITLPIVLHGTTYVHVNYDMYYTTDHFSMNKNYLQIFSGKMQNFFLYLYIHVYIYMFIYTYLFCFWKENWKKKFKCWKHKTMKNLAAVIFFLLPDPDDVCLISAGNSELSKTSSY